MVISNIEFELGKDYKIDDLDELQKNEKDLIFLKNNGITNICRLHKSEYEIMFDCIKKTLNNVDTENIKKVIFSTSSFDDYSNRKHLYSQLLSDLGMENAIPIGLFLSRCNSYSAALKMAKSIITGEEISHVLIICFDWVAFSSKIPQIMISNSSVLSDGVVSFLVSEEGTKGFEVVDIELSTNQILYNKTSIDYVNQIKILTEEIKSLCKRILNRNCLSNNDFKYFITGNYNFILQKNYALLSGFDINQINFDGISIGHAFSSDQLISLSKLEKSRKLKGDDKIFLLGTGDYYWGATILKKLKN